MIAVVGEALVDLTLAPDGSIAAHLGGGPFNTARTLARLGVPVTYAGRLSSDVFGTRLRQALLADGVVLPAAPATDDPTTLALAQLDAGGTATYRFYTEGTSVPGLHATELAALVPDHPSALHVGTLALVLEPLAGAVEALVAAAGPDTLVLVDPNVRPAVITDPAGYRARLERVLARADVVKVSDDDLAWLDPGASPVVAASALLDLGPRLVLLTAGARGATVLGRGFEHHVPAPLVEVADSIGAGDAFAAGVLAWWHDHDRPDLGHQPAAVAAATFGCRVAAATVARPGASPPTRDELDELVPAAP